MKLHSIDYTVKALSNLLNNPPQWGVRAFHIRQCLSYSDLRLSFDGWERGTAIIYHRLTKEKLCKFNHIGIRELAVALRNKFQKMLDNVKQN